MPNIQVKLDETVVQSYAFDKDIMSIGRSRDNDITIDNLAVSRSHCRIRNMDGKFILTDLNSANGTYVNGVKITKTEIMDQDVISVGKHKLVFMLEAMKKEEAIGDAFGADRTMIVESTTEGVLRVIKGKNRDEEFRITRYETKVGRASDNDIVINDWFVSKLHAKIIKQGDNYVIKDVGSWKGTYVNEKQIKEPVMLREGDEVRLGSTRFKFGIFDERKHLQAEGRRPQEIGYEAAPSMPADLPPEMSSPFELEEEPIVQSAPGPRKTPSEIQPTVQIDAFVPTGSTTPPPDLEDLPGVDEVFEEDLNFDELPDPMAAERAASGERQMPGRSPSREVRHDTPPIVKTERVPVPPSPAFEPCESIASFAGVETGISWEEYDIYGEGAGTGWGRTPEEIEALQRAAAERRSSIELAAVAASAPSGEHSAVAEEDVDEELDAEKAKQVAMWEKALANKSPVIRRQAAKMLKKLTGRDYDFEA